jgi:cellulose synthase/poly-beta-1,6-N-acetylglucosamine synthase-like glycosyltransferase
MSIVETAFLALYFLVLAILSFYGSHRYLMTYLYQKYKGNLPMPAGPMGELPRVTVQLPLFNEMYVAERLIDAVCRIEYPRDRFEVQVLDDSTDETQGIARASAERWAAAGVEVAYIHRENREGYKAGALQHGLRSARGELVAVFDADFVPEPDFLVRTVHYFADPGVGMVQVRWGHLNRDFSALTQVQAVMLDGHFVIEHTARNRSGRFFNFNGTAGVWRRRAIDDAGGWEHDTLTEDMDLSYRAQLKGWRFLYLPEVVSPAEVPVEMNAFKTQQARWAKGSIQVARKLLPRILRSELHWTVKLEAFFHLTNNVAYLLMVLLSLLLPVSMVVRYRHGWYEVLFLDLPFFVAATVSVTSFFSASQREIGVGFWERVRVLPFVMALGIGMCLSQARAVAEALLGKETEFTRTPKLGVRGKDPSWFRKRYRGLTSAMPFLELLFGAYYSYAVWFALNRGIWFSLPFLFLFQLGFLYVGLMSLVQGRLLRLERAREAARA